MEPHQPITTDEIRGFVRPHQVHRRAYADPEVFRLEMERIYGRMWIYVAHESQVKEAGAFFRTRLGPVEVLVTRDAEGGIHVLHNRCPHRGARICMVDRGTSKLLNCPYHAWSFRPDGTLSTVPHPQSYPESFNLDDPVNHMQRVPNVARYRGFIFASLAEAPPPLLDQLGAMTEIIDNLVDRAPEGEVEVSETAFVIEYRGNWKLHIENAADIFHPSFVHSSSVGAARRAPQTPSRLDSEQTRTMLEGNAFGVKQWEGLQLVGLPGGHTYMSSFYSKGVLVDQDDDPVMLEYKRRMVAAWGREKTEATLGVDRFNNIIYPNMVLNAGHQQMRVTLPLSHGRTQVRVQCFRLKGAPDEMYHRAVRFLSTIASPASMIFSDDVEMLERCQVGLERDDSPWLDFSRGFGADTSVTAERISTVASEMPMRVQFRAWVDYMTREGA